MIEDLELAMGELGKVLDRYRKVGARDTEPEVELAYLLKKTLDSGRVIQPGENAVIDDDAENPFSLYSNNPRRAEATAAITAAYVKAAGALLGVSVVDLKRAKEVINMWNF